MSVAEDTPSAPYPKLPFWHAVGLSYSTYFSHFIDAMRVSWVWLVLVAALSGIASRQQWAWMATTIENTKSGVPPQISIPLEVTAFLQLDYIFVLLAGVSIAVAWHRLMILDEHPGFSGSNLASKNLWRYILAGIGLVLILLLPIAAIVFSELYFLAPVQLGASPSSGYILLSLIALAIYVVAFFVVLRLCLLMPARAVGDTNLTVKQTWTRTSGNFWRLFWGIAFTTAPPVLIAEIMFFVLILTNGLPDPAHNGGKDFVTQMTAASVIFYVYYLLITPISIGFLSHAYRHFFRNEMETALPA